MRVLDIFNSLRFSKELEFEIALLITDYKIWRETTFLLLKIISNKLVDILHLSMTKSTFYKSSLLLIRRSISCKAYSSVSSSRLSKFSL